MTTTAPLGIERWRPAWTFAGRVHRTQMVPDESANYLSHLGAVTLEIIAAHLAEPIPDLDLAVQCAILHDTMEDQSVTYDDLERRFGKDVADGVSALSKRSDLAKAEAMDDSLRRIRERPAAIWCVKLADRITNLHGVPPHWPAEKTASYRTEAQAILAALAPAHGILAHRLAERIARYPGNADD